MTRQHSLLLLASLLSIISSVNGHGDHSLRGNSALRVQHNHNHEHEHHHHDHDEDDEDGVRELYVDDHHQCGTHDMDASDKSAQGKALNLGKYRQAKRKGSSRKESYEANSPKVIPVCFHVIGGWIPKRKLQKDLDALNRAFSTSSCCDPNLDWCDPNQCSAPQTNIRFVMARSFFGRVLGTSRRATSLLSCVRRRFRPQDLSNDAVEEKLKKRLRMGNGEILNVYFGNVGDGLLGFAYYPNILHNKPYLDGVVINRNSRVGGKMNNYNEGDTLAHEVGHWLGLPHTFSGGCSPGNEIPDLPRQNEPSYGCSPQEYQNSCPVQPSLEGGMNEFNGFNGFNYMDYSYDRCMYEWSQGQVDVMHANIEYFRQGQRGQSNPVELLFGEYSKPASLVRDLTREFYVTVPSADSEVVCKVHATGGDADLFIQWEGESGFTCAADGPLSSETCFFGGKAGRANVIVSAGATMTDFTVLCSLRETASGTTQLTLDQVTTVSGAAQGVFQSFSLPLGTLNIFESFGALTCHARSDDDVDVDLYMSLSDDVEQPLCVSQKPDTVDDESCQLAPGGSDKANIWLFSAQDATQKEISLECSIVPFPATEISSGVPSLPRNVAVGETTYFYVQVSEPSTVVCESEASNGNVDLLMAVNTPTNYECVSDSVDPKETCAIKISDGYAFVEIPARLDTADMVVTCTIRPIQTIELTAGQQLTGLHSERGEYAYFKINNPGSAAASCSIQADNGDLDLYMNYDGSHEFLCLGTSVNSNESCSLPSSEGASEVYAVVYGYSETLNYSIVCSLDNF